MSYLSELDQKLKAMTTDEYRRYKEERQNFWRNYSLKSSFFGVSYIVLLPFILFVIPIELGKITWVIVFTITAIICYLDFKYGSLTSVRRMIGVRVTKYRLRRYKMFGRYRNL